MEVEEPLHRRLQPRGIGDSVGVVGQQACGLAEVRKGGGVNGGLKRWNRRPPKPPDPVRHRRVVEAKVLGSGGVSHALPRRDPNREVEVVAGGAVETHRRLNLTGPTVPLPRNTDLRLIHLQLSQGVPEPPGARMGSEGLTQTALGFGRSAQPLQGAA